MNIFITGASGYIGGSVAVALLQKGHRIRGLTRTQNGADQLRVLGIEPVIGQLDDINLLTQEARFADAVINTASADHQGAVETLIAAMRDSGKALLHTSGSSIIGDDVRGDCSTSAIFSEDTPLVIDPRKQARRTIDLLVVNASALNIRSAVIIPSLIYGSGSGVNKLSIQLPFLVANAQKQKAVQIVGKGLNVWSNVHIDDLVDLYVLALEQATKGSFYFAENGEASFLDIAKAISQRLGGLKVEHLSAEVAVEKWGMPRALFSFGSNSRVRSVRARSALGWSPKQCSVQNWILHSMEFRLEN
jgi:nucleoside-diphosphate-sugar epimerase